jgi:hypothetical protein
MSTGLACAGPKVSHQIRLMIAGGLAGAVAKTVTAPLGRLTILFQLGSLHSHADSVRGALKHIVVNQVRFLRIFFVFIVA